MNNELWKKDLALFFGELVKAKRTERGISQWELAQNIPVSERTLRRWEDEGITKVENLQDCLKVLGLDIRDVFSDVA